MLEYFVLNFRSNGKICCFKYMLLRHTKYFMCLIFIAVAAYKYILTTKISQFTVVTKFSSVAMEHSFLPGIFYEQLKFVSNESLILHNVSAYHGLYEVHKIVILFLQQINFMDLKPFTSHRTSGHQATFRTTVVVGLKTVCTALDVGKV